jgi:hypothetical protein
MAFVHNATTRKLFIRIMQKIPVGTNQAFLRIGPGYEMIRDANA